MYKRILLIEDDRDIVELYATVLKEQGFETDIAYDGTDGLSKAQSGVYDLLLVDLMLPNVTGSDIIRIARNPDLSPHVDPTTTVIVLTNMDLPEESKANLLKQVQGLYLKVDLTPHRLVDIIKETSDAQPTPAT